MPLGQHTPHSDGELEAVNIALTQLLVELGPSRRLLYSVIQLQQQSLAKVNTPSKRVTKINLSIKQLKGLQKDMKVQWVPSTCGAVTNDIADYVAKKGTTISLTPA
jgi:ribonuclease HI